ncbi:hypothetical protein PPYR_00588 [Photinus pyralis]|uniref:Uncharacterized protein n=1 Tax=Photinus pyralis TaxID=7054 RepID=A0A1Y1LVV2_PHOPY|nr:uncharacterized protein LOC116158565 [Photinus pyralis]KAB0803618.1 hypothetical protein PPYR_00588 [Photinus pyralis]
MVKILCLLLLIALCRTHFSYAMALNAEDICAEETKISMAKVWASYREESISEEDEEYGKYFHCVWLMKKLMDVNGSIDKTEVQNFLEKEISQDFTLNASLKQTLKEAAERCSKLDSASVQRKSVKLKNCITSTIRSSVFPL